MITLPFKKNIPLTVVTLLVGLLLLVLFASSCNQDGDGSSNDAALVLELLAKAEPDECFCGIGAEDNGPISNSATGDCSDLSPEEPLTVCVPKISQSYVWAIAKIGTRVWFGTLPNAICVVSSTQFTIADPELNELYVCEYEESYVASSKPDPLFGDHRTSQIEVFDTGDGSIQDVSVADCDGQALLDTTLALRQAGSVKIGDTPLVIFAGPSLLGGVNMFAFDAEGNACLAAKHFPDYNDGRRTIVVDNNLYAAVGKSVDGENPGGGGRVLRYVGDLTDPLRWEEVGKLDTIGAVLTFHEGRIYVGTWPNVNPVLGDPGPIQNFLNGPRAGIYMSPVIPPGGLTGANLNDWKKVWETSDYEPYSILSAIYGVGEIASFQGRLWWGTINVPLTSIALHIVVSEPDLLPVVLDEDFLAEECLPDPECSRRVTEAYENTRRATVLFRGRNLDATPEFELLYGESSLPVFNSSTGEWELQPNKMSLTPVFGKSGIENPDNSYTWAMAVFRDELYVGTFDSSIVNPYLDERPANPFGADLYRFSDLSSGGHPVSLDGLGNSLNYGIRNILPDEDGKNGDDGLYIGTANPFNLAPAGGWELLRLR